MASEHEINQRLTVHHRDAKTGAVKRTTPYQRHVVNGIVTYVETKTGIEFAANWDATGKTYPVSKAALTESELLRAELVRLEKENADLKDKLEAGAEASDEDLKKMEEFQKKEEAALLGNEAKIEAKPSTAFQKKS